MCLKEKSNGRLAQNNLNKAAKTTSQNQKYFRHSTISSSMPTRKNTNYGESESIDSSNQSFKKKSNLKFRKRVSTVRKVELAGDDGDDDDGEEGKREEIEKQKKISSLTFGASPVNADYDSDRLQKELDHLKKSRKLYGAQWLLSSPNLLTVPLSDDSLGKTPAPMKVETLKDIIERNQEMKDNEFSSAVIIDSFAVNKINISVDAEFSETKICFLALSEKYLIEKDEINQDINEYYEFIHFIDGKIDRE